jgi:hypothetical protein
LEVPEYAEDENLSEDNTSDEVDTENQNHADPSTEVASSTPSVENTFQLGQFACPLLYTKKFPLHWRIPVNGAFKSLATETFRMFAIKNKAHMFVIEREDTVVYCKLYEESPGNINHMVSKLKDIRTPSTTAVSSMVPTTPISTSSSAFKDGYSSGTPQLRGKVQNSEVSSTEMDSSNAKYKAQDNRHLVLDVYGVDLPSWIENELIDMVENRLMSHITLREMQQFLLRNPTSKLSPTVRPMTQRHYNLFILYILIVVCARMWNTCFPVRDPQQSKFYAFLLWFPIPSVCWSLSSRACWLQNRSIIWQLQTSRMPLFLITMPFANL